MWDSHKIVDCLLKVLMVHFDYHVVLNNHPPTLGKISVIRTAIVCNAKVLAWLTAQTQAIACQKHVHL